MAVIVDKKNGKQINNKQKKGDRRVIKIIITGIILIIILAAVIDLYLVYLIAPSVKISPNKIENFTPITTNDYEIGFILTLKNPTNAKVQVEKVTYNIYIEFHLVDHGEKSSFQISPGESDHTFLIPINILDLPASIRNNLLSSTVSIKINGIMIIPIHLMRTIKIGEITREYEILDDISPNKAFFLK